MVSSAVNIFQLCGVTGMECNLTSLFHPMKDQPRSQGPLSSYLEKVPWLRLVTCYGGEYWTKL